MNPRIIVIGFIVLLIGGFVYTLVPFTTTTHYEANIGGNSTVENTTSTTTTGTSPIGTIIMIIGFTTIVVGLFYSLQKPEPPKTEQEPHSLW